MATALQTITRAMKIAGILADEEAPTASEAQDALSTLNAMIAAWELEGIAIGARSWELTDVIQLPENHLETIRFNLAARLYPEYGITPNPVVVSAADNGYRALQGAYGTPIEMSTGLGLIARLRWRYPA